MTQHHALLAVRPTGRRRGVVAALLATAVSIPLSLVVTGVEPGSTAVAATSPNLVVNAGFETGTASGWRTSNANRQLLRAILRPHTGHYSGRLTTTVKSTAVINDRRNTVLSTTRGATYVARAYVRTTTPSVRGALRMREVRNGRLVRSVKERFSLPDTKWHLVRVPLTAAAGGDRVDLNVLAYYLPRGKNLLVDDVSLVRTTTPTTSTTTATSSCSVNAILVPSCGAWLGVASNSLNGESYDQAMTNFESAIGRHVAIAHYYHRGTQLFPTKAEIGRATQSGANRLLLENWKPENGHTWAGVAAGASDRLIDEEAAWIKGHFARRFFLAIHGEPERSVKQNAGSGYTASNYRAMYRHVILRLRADGVRNMVSVLDLTGLPTWGSKGWFKDLYPGNDVVDWLAEDPYDIGPTGSWYDNNYSAMVNRKFPGYSFPGFYTWATNVAPNKPIMLAEWGVDELSGHPGWKPNHFSDFANRVASCLPRVRALVYWNSDNFYPVGTTRVNSSSASLTAFRHLAHLTYLNPPVPHS